MRRLIIMLCGCLAVAITRAGGLQVAPVTLSIPADRPAQILWLTNTGNAPTGAQIRVYHWRQQDGKDLLEPARDLAVSPPMMSIAPGGRQLVRVIRQRPVENQETAWRLIVDELPADARPRGGLQFVLRYSIPVFLLPPQNQPLQPQLRARLQAAAFGWLLHIHNNGNQHARLAELRLRLPGAEETILLPGLVGYVLPGSTMTWRLPATPPPTRGTLRVRINGEMEASPLPVDGG